MNDQMNEQVRKELKIYLDKYGTPLVFIAIKVGLSKSVISRWKNNKFNFSLQTLRRIQQFIGTREQD
ncbi:helix-turn-helix domain-containing protein [Bacillus pseudomycoides]|uniref:helix-turn-helix domain-containing protein n=1 Tax=Bacillus pseudomycoides TaxID=64104 RepID=UPI000BF829E0|nr:helix-turn-helix transcriptional regulator [Bacillus pseudomycoides]PGC41916.1 hypothetical protein COM18_09685 [Bacillus pseudomycoides]